MLALWDRAGGTFGMLQGDHDPEVNIVQACVSDRLFYITHTAYTEIHCALTTKYMYY